MFLFWGKHRFRYGLVLSGGGAKGAYQIGALKALDELGIADQVTAVSGSSIGAINGLLFASGEPDVWEKAWLEVNYQSFFGSGGNSTKAKLGSVLLELIDRGRGLGLQEFLARLPLFSQSGLEEYLRKYIPPEAIKKIRPRLYSCAYNLEESAPEYFCLNDYSYEDVLKLVLASSAIPVVYSPVSFGDCHYVDGGKAPPYIKKDNSDKIPIAPLRGESCEIVIILYLKQEDRVDTGGFAPGTRFLELYPSRPLEKIPGAGTLDFAPQTLAGNQRLGYTDTMAALAPIMIGRLRGKTLDELLARHDEQNRAMRRRLDALREAEGKRQATAAGIPQ